MKPEDKQAEAMVEQILTIQEEAQKMSNVVTKQALARVEDEAVKILDRARFLGDEIIKKFRRDTAKLKSAVMSVEVGEITRPLTKPMNPHLPEVLKLAKSGEHVCLVGPAGCGKTQLALQVAESMGLPFGALTFTSGASETWLFGRNTPTGFVEAIMPKLAREGGVFLADEIDGADPNMSMVLNTMLDSDVLYNPYNGEILKLHKDFVFLAAANTFLRGADVVYSGRNRQDGAFRDRFVIYEMDYVDEIDRVVCPDDDIRAQFQKARKKLRDLNSSEFLSTRALRKAYVMKQLGFDMGKILRTTTAGWPEETVKETGLASPKV